MNVGPNRDQRFSLLLLQDDTTQSRQNHPVLQPAKWHDQNVNTIWSGTYEKYLI